MPPAVEMVACPVCGGGDFARTPGAKLDPMLQRVAGQGARSTWAICRGCGLVLQNPRLTVEQTQELYSAHAYHSYSDGHLAQTLAYALRRPEPLIDYLERVAGLGNSGTVIDVGCGLGGALVCFRLKGWDAHGVEPDPELARVAQELGNDVRVEFFDEDSFPAESADLVYTCHAFEHFLDPLAIARAAHATLRADGLLFVCVPTFKQARVPARAWMNSSHTFLFTHRTLGNLLFRGGFELVAHHYHSPEGELWCVARKGRQVVPATAALPYPEDWRAVSRELAVTAQARAGLWWGPRTVARNAHHLATLALDPAEFGRKAFRRIAARQHERRAPAGKGSE
jgi:SAM-dependent methyltransferase